MADPSTLTVGFATGRDRQAIYRLRHQVYARELRQHRETEAAMLSDALDRVNIYLVARRNDVLVGFISITPPNPAGYSIDKYFARRDLPFDCDAGLLEVRLLTVVEGHRRSSIAALLMYAALRYAERRGATRIAGIGRRDLMPFYERAGLKRHGLTAQSGAVTYELMSASVAELRHCTEASGALVARIGRSVRWGLDGSAEDDGCFHGGAFWDAIGDTFETLERRHDVIAADVLDAWFDPAPQVVAAVQGALAFALKTSPPTHADGLRQAIARARGVTAESILPGAGSSDLIFAALGTWVTPGSRVLMLDPMYGEYAHLLVRVIGATVDRLLLSRDQCYDVQPDDLRRALARGYDWVVIVNPNSPTGRHVARASFERLVAEAPAQTRFWIDETYVDYVAESESLEVIAAASDRLVVCKSMSKAYALSGVRAAYLCGPPDLIAEARRLSPPWSVGLPAQIAACSALAAPEYYRERWRETARLRRELHARLDALGLDVVPGCANFLLCHLPASWPDAATLIATLRLDAVYLRDAGPMSPVLGERAVRIAVKDAVTNRRVVAALDRIAGSTGPRATS
jgi:histidinol-phosphate/aromatic aminotransferase/cobyric acid decarboxylase-like protein/GNAT superfamily N-acetyltransferase